MSKSLRRFEMPLPLRFNDGDPVPAETIAELLDGARGPLGAVSSETQTIHGYWRHEGTAFRDDLARIFVDVPDTPETRQFFEGFKERLKSALKQIDIWMTTYPIEVI